MATTQPVMAGVPSKGGAFAASTATGIPKPGPAASTQNQTPAFYNSIKPGAFASANERDTALLQGIGGIAARGAHKMGAGSMESMSPTMKGIFTSGLKASGVNADEFEKQYQLSRARNDGAARAL